MAGSSLSVRGYDRASLNPLGDVVRRRGRAREVHRALSPWQARQGERRQARARQEPLYGYDRADSSRSRYVVNPITAPVVRRTFEASLSGASIRGIAAMLTADRIPIPRGTSDWSPVVIRNMLRNSADCGEAFAFRIQQMNVAGTNRTRSVERPRDAWVPLPEGTVPAIVERGIFDAAQERLRRNLAQSPRRLNDLERYLLRGGYVRCGYCGNAMSAVKGGPRNVGRLYRCTRLGRRREPVAHTASPCRSSMRRSGIKSTGFSPSRT